MPPKIRSIWLELLKEAAPQVSRVAYLWNPANHSSASSWEAMQGLAPRVGVTLQSAEVRDPKDIDAALAAIIRDRAEGVILDSDVVMAANHARIVEFAAANRLPLRGQRSQGLCKPECELENPKARR